ncbi:MAG: MBL fold metallo-hydrolase [Proteobacteria bacterium]|nr:MBL fold metallo-hydrolase [Pseudomonadota bacterium]
MIEIEDVGEIRKFRLARTFLGRPIYYTAAYLVDGLMIDSGCAYTVRELAAALEGLPLRRIVNTHSHEDHIAANAELARRFKAEIEAHPFALHILASPAEERPLKPYQRVMWGYPEPSEARAIGDTIETENHRFEVIHTPGHSPDHICLYEPEKGWLFCGDAYIGGRDRSLRADYNIWQTIGSLQKLLALEVALLFPGSGRVRRKARRDLMEKADYLLEVSERIQDLHRRGLGYERIGRRVFGREPSLYYITLGHFSVGNLVRSFIEDRPTS